ncbi:1-hydroxy-2-methyl-2-(E)-butenyl 4-diphosphate synthase [uncultured Actinomyces sp.]|uniref:1-hydroxy-2-methyl-2-(E)-butenyl 4-diphosphate synthase n=1 Tax=uncultured Actinomyces sp. TaxID=249061 RepID=UPI001CB31635|nr:1-hydroxy-2-methyl-2-(E)-butenyl 4-diphosphate synthase [uncultured Actinomyces sp.]MBF0958934.1 1-hydroxy-2-methyl-2-(E)-butenyl 4-diphosphate synthase [Actinomyces sp.]
MSERGDASVEFLGILVVLVIPVLYIVLAIGQVSAGAMAVDAGAREAARILAQDSGRRADAERAVALIVEDFGVDAPASVSSSCAACASSEGAIEVSVSVRVPLPFLPAWLGTLGVTVSSSASAPVREVVAGG